MSDSTYVALTPLKWGEGWIQPGETVPLEDGRRYDLMEMAGQIRTLPPQTGGDTSALTQERDALKAKLDAYEAAVGPLLPEDFPGRAALFKAGYFSAAAVKALPDDALKSVKGIGDATLTDIRAYKG